MNRLNVHITRRYKMIEVFDKNKVFGSSIWSYLYDQVPVQTMLEDGYDCCENWITSIPETDVRTVGDNEDFYKEELADLGYYMERK